MGWLLETVWLSFLDGECIGLDGVIYNVPSVSTQCQLVITIKYSKRDCQ